MAKTDFLEQGYAIENWTAFCDLLDAMDDNDLVVILTSTPTGYEVRIEKEGR